MPSSHRPVIWIAQTYWVDALFHGIAQYAAGRGWVLDAAMRWQRGPITGPAQTPDGIIVFTGSSPELASIVKRLAVPTVDIEDYVDHYGAPKVIGDDREIGRMAARHLAACRPARLAAIAPATPHPVAWARLAGFRAEAAEAGLPVLEVELAGFDPRAVVEKGAVALFAGSDFAAMEVLRRTLEAGLRVPEDLAILGADDTEYVCELAPVPLSSIGMNFEEKGRQAAALLDRLMRGDPPPRRPIVVPPAHVTVRASTQVIRTGHETLDRLVQHLRENAHRAVGIDVLCAECGIPLRTAQHLLQTRLHLTALSLLTRFRLENAARLARSGKLSREMIARAAGFGGRATLLRAERAAAVNPRHTLE